MSCLLFLGTILGEGYQVSRSRVDFIVKNFDIDFWMPILINSEYFLLDGQHRLEVAKKLGLKYIDAVIVKEQMAIERR
jgi:hypothetical protein